MPTGDSLSAFYGGGGQFLRVTVPDPGAGLNFSQAVPAGVEWRLVAGSWILTNGVTIIVRGMTVLMRSGGMIVFSTHSAIGILAGTVARFSVGLSGYEAEAFIFPTAPGAGGTVLGTPDCRMLEGDIVLESLVVNLQPGDALTDIHLIVEQYAPTE